MPVLLWESEKTSTNRWQYGLYNLLTGFTVPIVPEIAFWITKGESFADTISSGAITGLSDAATTGMFVWLLQKSVLQTYRYVILQAACNKLDNKNYRMNSKFVKNLILN